MWAPVGNYHAEQKHNRSNAAYKLHSTLLWLIKTSIDQRLWAGQVRSDPVMKYVVSWCFTWTYDFCRFMMTNTDIFLGFFSNVFEFSFYSILLFYLNLFFWLVFLCFSVKYWVALTLRGCFTWNKYLYWPRLNKRDNHSDLWQTVFNNDLKVQCAQNWATTHQYYPNQLPH